MMRLFFTCIAADEEWLFKQHLVYPWIFGMAVMQFLCYRKDTEPLYHSFMYSLVTLLSGIYPLPAMLSLLVTLYVTAYLIVGRTLNFHLHKNQ